MLVNLGDVTFWPDVITAPSEGEGHTKEERRPSGQSVNLPAGNYDLDELRARGIGNDRISYIAVPTDLVVVVFQDAHFQGKKWTISGNRYNLTDPKLRPDGFDWNDQISSMMIVNKADVPPLRSTAEYLAFWNARTEQARAEYAQRETARRQEEAARQQAATLAAVREQAAQQAAAQAAQIESARLAAELQIALAEQRARAARETVTTPVIEPTAWIQPTTRPEVYAPENYTIQPVTVPEVTAMLPVSRAVPPRRAAGNGTILLVGAGALAAYLYKRSKNKGAS